MTNKKRRGRKRGQGIVATLRDPKKIRTLYIIVALTFIFGGSLSFGGAECQKQAQQIRESSKASKPIAQIEDRKISHEKYARELIQQRRRDEMQEENKDILHPPEYWADMNYRVLRRLIDMEYFDIRARQAGITVSPEEVEAKIDEYRRMLVPAKSVEEERSLLQRFLDAIGAVKTERAFEDKLRMFDPQLTLAKLREQEANIIIAQKYLDKLQKEEQKKIDDELVARMTSIREEILKTNDFAEAAKKHSQDNSAAAGGLIPLIKHDTADLPKPVIETAFTLPPGEISQPIIATEPEARKGVWLITVTSRKDASGPDWDKDKETIRQKLLEKKKKDVEEGKAEMPEDGNITVSDEEVKNYYEEATIRGILLKGEDPMSIVQKSVVEDMKKLNLKIFDPELRATHHIVNEEWSLAAADFMEALQKNSESLEKENVDPIAVDLEEARLRYLLANLWATRAFRIESEWLQNIWSEFQANPAAFNNEFPQTPVKIRKEQQGYFVMALKNLDRAIELEEMDPWPRIQRVQIEMAREQLSPRMIQDLQVAHEYSSEDFNLENRILSSIRQIINLDDKALEKAKGKRPEKWTPPTLPEDEMGLTLESLCAPYKALIGQWETVRSISSDKADKATPDVLSAGGNELEQNSAVSTESTDSINDNANSASISEIVPPDIPVPEMSGPLTKEDRDNLEKLLDEVQEVVDRLSKEREAKEAERQKEIEKQKASLPKN